MDVNYQTSLGIPWCPVVRTQGFQGCGPGFGPWSGKLRSHKTQCGKRKKNNNKNTKQKNPSKISYGPELTGDALGQLIKLDQETKL